VGGALQISESVAREIRPNPGPQTAFLATSADIAIFGGQAGGGKSYGLLLDPCRWIGIPGFGATIFRRHSTDLTQEGGLWDEAMKLYPLFKGRPRESQGKLDFRFPWGSRISFSHLQYEETVERKQGGQIAIVGMDEITHFLGSQFWYMLSRNRSTCGVRPYFRGTCNPDPDSFIAPMVLSYWVDPETGYPISARWWDRVSEKYRGVERSGVIRWLVKQDDDIRWFATRDEAVAHARSIGLADPTRVKSFTFIPSSIYDNKPLLEKDPDYIGNLQLQNRINRARLLDGNWIVRATGGLTFNRGDFEIIDKVNPADVVRTIRVWDLAGTEAKRVRNLATMRERMVNDPDWTVGLKAVLLRNKDIVFVDMARERTGPSNVQKLVADVAKQDGRRVTIVMPQDPGQAGKDQIENYRKRVVPGYTLKSKPESGSKLTRAEPYSQYATAEHVKLLRAPWNDVFLSEHHAFPSGGVHDDIVDTGSGAFEELIGIGMSTAMLMAKRAKGQT
jgi:predicted phage terminase large subunit-like protein